MKKLLCNYYKHTPIKWRKIGDSLLAAGTAGAGLALANDIKWLAVTLTLMGVIGKFISNFATDEPKTDQ